MSFLVRAAIALGGGLWISFKDEKKKLFDLFSSLKYRCYADGVVSPRCRVSDDESNRRKLSAYLKDIGEDCSEKSELEKYEGELLLKWLENEDFDILTWWKTRAPTTTTAALAATPTAATATPTTPMEGGKASNTFLKIVLPVTIGAILATIFVYFCFQKRRRPTRMPSLPYLINPDDIKTVNSLMFDLSTLQVATNNFAESNKLGEGGFGAVYKGTLPDGKEIAVKRLSQSSNQGIRELKNELVLVAKLQHKNLVRLVGACLEKHEMLLAYEYMPNRSLDTILFDPEKSKELDWGKRFKIINRIARGLQYLHEESQLKIIHRDLKASNVLLDSDLSPKISDFGLARLFGENQSQIVTNRVVGTYGYMAPEYAMRGQYSVKSDVFSFGVMILEIVAGRRNMCSYNSENYFDLLGHMWAHWITGTIIDTVDPSLDSSSQCSPRDQMIKCVHIGLLCVQNDPNDRPMLSTVNLMLSNDKVSLKAPRRPAFCTQRTGDSSRSTVKPTPMSLNQVSITELDPR